MLFPNRNIAFFSSLHIKFSDNMKQPATIPVMYNTRNTSIVMLQYRKSSIVYIQYWNTRIVDLCIIPKLQYSASNNTGNTSIVKHDTGSWIEPVNVHARRVRGIHPLEQKA